MIGYIICSNMGYILHVSKDYIKNAPKHLSLSFRQWFVLHTTRHLITLLAGNALTLAQCLDGELTYVGALAIGYASDSALKWVLEDRY